MLDHHIEMLLTDDIIVDRDQRQRQGNLSIDDLIPSVRARGILQPLIVDAEQKLIAGERRLLTAKFLKLEQVPTIRWNSLDEGERQIIELEENIKRKDLTWQDRAKATLKIHTLYLEREADWSVSKSSTLLGLNEDTINKAIDVAEALLSGDESIAKCDTQAAAVTILTRRRARARDEVIQRITEMNIVPDEDTVVEETEEEKELVEELMSPLTTPERKAELETKINTLGKPAVVPAPKAIPYAIQHADFSEWAASYDGPRFNFLHVDFPYGVVLNEQANQDAFEGGGYDSTPEIYWKLCEVLTENWDRIMYPSAHVMFWISMKFYTETVEFFTRAAADYGTPVPSDLKINPTPLIWHKTDGKGIISDAMRGPRNIYEACLMMSTGDRKIVRPVANVYGAPTSKADAIHTNEKPEPMLRHFLSMFVDHHSRVLDPTCGSGSAIRVAEGLGAEAALGLELNPEFAARSQDRLVRARGLRLAAAAAGPLTADALAASTLDTEEEA